MLAGASSIALGFFFVAFVFVGLSIYSALAWQIRTGRTAAGVDRGVEARKTFGLPEAFLAAGLVLWFLLISVTASIRRSPIQLSDRDLVLNFLFTLVIVFSVAAFLKVRGIDIDSLGGFSKTSLHRALSTAVVLLLAATPLILLAEALTQNAFGSGSSRQEIVDLFNSSHTIQQGGMIILLGCAG